MAIKTTDSIIGEKESRTEMSEYIEYGKKKWVAVDDIAKLKKRCESQEEFFYALMEALEMD